MFPDKLIWDIDLYTIFMCVGVFLGIMLFGTLADGRKIRNKLQNVVLISGVCCIVVAFGSATLFQAFYNYMQSGVFEITADTGATFYGGFIGGVISFVLIYFVSGGIAFKDKYHIWHLPEVLGVAICSVPLAHGFGRIGCLMAGCCHGRVTDAWYGIMMHGDLGYQKYVPVQLFETVFLFVLAAALIVKTWKFKNIRYNISIYVVCYSIWRFFAEYMRGDVRGESLVDFLSPSQLIAIILVAVGFGYMWLEDIIFKKCNEKIAVAEAVPDAKKPESTTAESAAAEKTAGESVSSENACDECNGDKRRDE